MSYKNRMLKKGIFTFFAFCLVLSFLATVRASVESDFINLMNTERTSLGKCVLYENDNLETAGYLHTKDMAENNYFSHNSLDGKTFVDRIKNAGYRVYSSIGENLAYHTGMPDAQRVFTMWKNSPGHYANMIGSFKEAGLGYYYYNGATYYVLDLGTRPNFVVPSNQTPINNTINQTILTNITLPPKTNITIPATPLVINNGNGLTITVSKSQSGSRKYITVYGVAKERSKMGYNYNGKNYSICSSCLSFKKTWIMPIIYSKEINFFAINTNGQTSYFKVTLS